jgi:hypothetical protein
MDIIKASHKSSPDKIIVFFTGDKEVVGLSSTSTLNIYKENMLPYPNLGWISAGYYG